MVHVLKGPPLALNEPHSNMTSVRRIQEQDTVDLSTLNDN